MVWTPISGLVPQGTSSGDQASGYVVKFYESGTTTPLAVATDSTGGTTSTNFLLDAQGYTTLSSTRIIPHVDQAYKIVLYLNQTDADANDTGSAVYVRDNIVLGNENLGNPSSDGQLLSSTTSGTRSWVDPGEADLGNPPVDDYILSSKTDGTRSWIANSGGSGTSAPIQVSFITTSGTYTPPSGATWLKVICKGGGSGGGPGRDPALGIYVTSAGGTSGNKAIKYITSIDSSYSVTIGAGGAGAATAPASSGDGGDTLFGTVCKAKGGPGGISGQSPRQASSSGNIGDVIEYGIAGSPGIGQRTTYDYFGIWSGGTGGGEGGGPAGFDAIANSGAGGGGGGFQAPTNPISSGDGAAGYIIVEAY